MIIKGVIQLIALFIATIIVIGEIINYNKKNK